MLGGALSRIGSACAAGVLLLASFQGAFALSIADHLDVTQRAFQEWQACHLEFPVPDDPSRFHPTQGPTLGQSQGQILEWIERANAEEDLNLIRKWTHYSHYFNPWKKLDMSRVDSGVTIQESVQALSGGRLTLEDRSRLLGRIIHHIQDAAVPAHVIPVSHWLWDGFENLKVRWPKMEPDCAAIQKVRDLALEPIEILSAQAMDTWGTLDQSLVAMLNGDKPQEIHWRGSFWLEGPGAEFGSYGKFGNLFGVNRLESGQGPIFIDARVYEDYKLGRLLAAVRSTQAAWAWLVRSRALFSVR